MTQADKLGIVVAGHGSRDPDAVREFEALVELVRARAPNDVVTHGYLEFSSPTIAEAVTANLAAGSRQLAVVPGVLLAARHAKNDMPAEVQAMARDYPDIDFHFGAPLNLHPKLLQLAQQRIVEAEATSPATVRRGDTCLVLVGRGTTDPDANGDVSKMARMLEEGMGFGAAYVCYSGTATPLVADGLRAAARMGYARLVVLPFFLFDGVLVKRIYAAADDLREREPGIEVLKAGYFGAHPHVADVMIERAREAVEGRAAMNCSLCKYRVQIVGFEQQVGEPQRAHHMAVRGLLAKEGAETAPAKPEFAPYEPHPIEAESFRIIADGRDWSAFPAAHLTVLQRLVHTSGDFDAVNDMYFSPGAIESGIRALLRCKRVLTDVTMVQTGLKRALLEQLGIDTWCGVHDRETHLMSEQYGITRSAAGIRRGWEKFGNDVVVSIGDAPTAIAEAVRLIRDHGWRPQLVIGLPVGFVGTRETKEELRRCLQVPRITNSGTRGGSPWAASVVNGMMIDALNQLAGYEPG
ncbi:MULTISPECIES: precorrin-8X methylmutase [unclassified Janthinobacterium]|uniref:precorrin-8X methylmutase n=1 Tax=unclassified Janthinobacterium TaxID=2610881 RepID=UPI0003470813|nr:MULTISPECIES: precorrin-8X methylmutase [unclassified Janthinobacterium]MEC5164007.1 precorrin-8X/cobalt-precorrin-8 methylmutase [Janthinobacterium sp. CG_S6]